MSRGSEISEYTLQWVYLNQEPTHTRRAIKGALAERTFISLCWNKYKECYEKKKIQWEQFYTGIDTQHTNGYSGYERSIDVIDRSYQKERSRTGVCGEQNIGSE